jgi:hypothetical protein
VDFLDSLSDADEQIPEMNGAGLRIELVVNDDCVIPTLTKIEGLIRVTIGLNHDFDDVLDVAGSDLSNEELAHLHKLWSDDNFPRTFKREGASLIITARDDQ